MLFIIIGVVSFWAALSARLSITEYPYVTWQ